MWILLLFPITGLLFPIPYLVLLEHLDAGKAAAAAALGAAVLAVYVLTCVYYFAPRWSYHVETMPAAMRKKYPQYAAQLRREFEEA